MYCALPLTEDKVYFIAEVMSEESNVSALHTIKYSFDEWISAFNDSENDKDEESFVVYNNDIPCAWLKLNGLLNKDIAYISMLVVSEKYKHKGVGTFAVGFAVDFLKSKGFTQIGLHTTEDNIIAVNLYCKFGFTKTKREKRKTESGIEVWDIAMEKALNMRNDDLGGTFDTVASTYEKFRPGYVDELYRTVFEYINIDSNSKAVEVGIGGGQATLPFLKTGCSLTAVDYGENFCTLCREKFKDYPNFSAVSGKFEELDFNHDEYDLIYSASAFHWIPEEIGYKKVYAMLKDGGVFARFANHPFRCKDDPDLSKEIDEIYARYYYKYYNKSPETVSEFTEKQAYRRALIAEKYGFRDIQYKLFYRTRTFTAEEYVTLIGTYSDRIAIEEKIRLEFFSEIEKAINQHGGEITIFDTIDLQLARK